MAQTATRLRDDAGLEAALRFHEILQEAALPGAAAVFGLDDHFRQLGFSLEP